MIGCMCVSCLKPTGKPHCSDFCKLRLKINLCTSCALNFSTCISSPVISEEVGGYGNNVVECDKYPGES